MTALTDRAAPPQPRWKTLTRALLVLVFLYLFLSGMAMMGSGLKSLGKNPDFDGTRPPGPDNREYREAVYEVFAYADHPVVALFLGILATSVFQSSSFTTSVVVSLVATGMLGLHQAIFVVMGANIGTSVTNTGVSFTHIRRREEFERAFGSATVHDFFNGLSVVVLLPVEWMVLHVTGRGLLERIAQFMASGFYSGTPVGKKPTNVLKEAVRPAVEGATWLLERALGLEHDTARAVLAALGVALLFLALVGLTRTLRSLVFKRVEQFFDRVLFRNAATAYVVGLVLTVAVQSSSITTSLAVPLVGAGLLTIYQVFPYTLGANLGTTVTALVASFAAEASTPELAQAGIALAFCHCLFNIVGAAVWYPLRGIPIRLAGWYARRAARSKRWAVVHVAGVFFVLPVLVVVLYWLWK